MFVGMRECVLYCPAVNPGIVEYAKNKSDASIISAVKKYVF